MTETPANRLWSSPPVARLARALRAAGAAEAHLVGGGVRDALLGLEAPADLDVALPRFSSRLPNAVARALGGSAFELDAQTCAWRVALPGGGGVDLVAYRGPTLAEDLAGRDFTVNALALDLFTGALADPLGGLADLASRTLRVCSKTSLADDPLRVLRAYRFLASRYFEIPPSLATELGSHAPEVAAVSVERVRDEWFRLLDGSGAGRALRALLRDGVLGVLFPFLDAWEGFDQGSYHSYDLLEHSLRAVEEVEAILADPTFSAAFPWLPGHLAQRHEACVTRLALLKCAALFHDIAKPATATTEAGGRRRFIGHDVAGGRELRGLLGGLKTGKATARAAERLVASHMRLFGLAHQPTPTLRSRLKFLRDLGDEAPEAVLLALADESATGPDAPARLKLEAASRELFSLFANPETDDAPLLLGRDLIAELGMPPGRELGQMLAAVGEAERRGEVQTREEALAWAKRRLGGFSE